VINAIGLTVTALVLVVVLITKFLHGAWIAILAMVMLFFLMRAIRRHYDRVAHELEAIEEDAALPPRIHAIVLVSKVHRPTLRALAYAKASRPNTLEAVTVDVDENATVSLLQSWDASGMSIPLKVLASPYREITRPVLEYVRALRRKSPRDVVTVYIPEYVVGHWWEHLLHNQSALRLKGRLLFTPGVMVTSVPFQLRSSALAERRLERPISVAGSVRRGPARVPRKRAAKRAQSAQGIAMGPSPSEEMSAPPEIETVQTVEPVPAGVAAENSRRREGRRTSEGRRGRQQGDQERTRGEDRTRGEKRSRGEERTAGEERARGEERERSGRNREKGEGGERRGRRRRNRDGRPDA
jgi:hypothetical protein